MGKKTKWKVLGLLPRYSSSCRRSFVGTKWILSQLQPQSRWVKRWKSKHRIKRKHKKKREQLCWHEQGQGTKALTLSCVPLHGSKVPTIHSYHRESRSRSAVKINEILHRNHQSSWFIGRTPSVVPHHIDRWSNNRARNVNEFYSKISGIFIKAVYLSHHTIPPQRQYFSLCCELSSDAIYYAIFTMLSTWRGELRRRRKQRKID